MYTQYHISHFGLKIYNIIINSQFKTSIDISHIIMEYVLNAKMQTVIKVNITPVEYTLTYQSIK